MLSGRRILRVDVQGSASVDRRGTSLVAIVMFDIVYGNRYPLDNFLNEAMTPRLDEFKVEVSFTFINKISQRKQLGEIPLAK